MIELYNETLLNSPEFKALVARLKPRKHTWRHYACLCSHGKPDRIVTTYTGESSRPVDIEFDGKVYRLTKYTTAGGYGIYNEIAN